MPAILQHVANYRHRLSAIVLLIMSTFVSLGLLIVRWVGVGYPHYACLVWDLFLAWMPFWVAVAIYVLHKRGSRNRPLLLSLGLVWLLFFPNAPYMVTEFVHLRRVHDGLWWFDLMTMIGFAWNGLMLGLLSLFTVHEVVRARLGTRQGWWMAATVLMLGGCGVALGRFQRFNSWDVIRHPFSLFGTIVGDLLNPEAARTGFVMAFVLGLFLLLAYVSLWIIVALNEDVSFRQPDHKGRIPTIR